MNSLLITSAVLLLTLGLVSGWRLKPDDKEQRIREAEEIASKDLESFKVAVANHDRRTLAQLTGNIQHTVREAQKNNEKLNKGLGPVILIMDKLAHATKLRRPFDPLAVPVIFVNFLKLRALQLLTNLLDGNRDNFSYYRLDAVRMWIERRTGTDGAQDVDELRQAHETVVAARDALETMASTFVAGLKEIKGETSHVFHEDYPKIQAAAEKVLRVSNENKDLLISETEATFELIDKAIQTFERTEVVTHTTCIFPGHPSC